MVIAEKRKGSIAPIKRPAITRGSRRLIEFCIFF